MVVLLFDDEVEEVGLGKGGASLLDRTAVEGEERGVPSSSGEKMASSFSLS